MRILLMFVTALLFAPVSYGQAHPEWLNQALKVDDPNELAYWLAINPDCPLTRQQLEDIVKDVLTKSRIKPLEKWKAEAEALYLNVSVQCASIENNNKHAYYVRAEFARYDPPPPVLFDAPMYKIGFGDKDVIRQNCRDIVDAAVTMFTRANLYVPIGLSPEPEREIARGIYQRHSNLQLESLE